MKSKTLLRLLIMLALITLSGIWHFSTLRQEQPLETFPATVNRDCAPWDGAAFTIMVQYDPTAVVYISIWRSPDIKFPTTFSFPDETGQVGNAYILSEPGLYTLLSGEVYFQHVDKEKPIEGRFNFISAKGVMFEGWFIAEWGDQVVYCG